MKRFFMGVIALFFPWLILFLKDNPGGAVVALIMQASIIGWIPASVWSYRVFKEGETLNKKTRKVDASENTEPKPPKK